MPRDLPDPSPRFGGFPKYNFVGGHNDPERIPIEGLIEATASVLRREGSKLAMYNLAQGPQGFVGLREMVADKLNRHRGMNDQRDEVLVTTGSGQGIDMISRMFVDPGDTVILEEFCYAGAINRFKRVGANIVGIPLDEDGMRMDVLASTLEGLKQKGVTPKYIYTIPTIQNPSGSILPLERRQQMLALAKQYGVPIFEDECYADLIWAGGAPPSLYAMDPKQVVHIGSFSKTLAPALRVGYAVAEWPVLSRMIACKTDSGTGALDQMIVAEYLLEALRQACRRAERRAEGEARHDGRGGGARVRHHRRYVEAEGRHLPVVQAAGQRRCAEAGEAGSGCRHPVQSGTRVGVQSGAGEVVYASVFRAAVEGGHPRRRRGTGAGLLRADRHSGAQRQRAAPVGLSRGAGHRTDGERPVGAACCAEHDAAARRAAQPA